MESKLQLHGFNNLTKSLSFNIYDICYAQTEEQREAYIDYIDEMYNAERLTQILTDVRGFTRDVDGTKHYIDHDINSIQNYLTEDTQNAYQMIDVNVYQENLFHTKMMLKNFDLDNYVFGVNASDLDPQEAQSIEDRLRREMLEIFYSRNVE